MTRRTLPKNKLLKIANAVKDATCKDKWDKFKTPAENLKSMGLDPNPNAVIRTGTGCTYCRECVEIVSMSHVIVCRADRPSERWIYGVHGLNRTR